MPQKSTVDFMIEDLQDQIRALSGEKAMFRGMATHKENEINQLRHQLDTAQKELEDLKKEKGNLNVVEGESAE